MKITGNIIDSDQFPLMGVNLSLIDESEKPLGVGGITNYDGEFNIDIGNVSPSQKVKISYMGFIPIVKKVSDLNNSTIKMYELLETLDTVTITASKSSAAKKKAYNWAVIASIVALILGGGVAAYVAYNKK